MTEKLSNGFGRIARVSGDGARETANYYAGSGKDERRLVKASFFTGVTGGVLWYVLILYWAALGFSSEEIGIMGGTGQAIGIITYLFGGFLADKLGRKRLFLVGLVSTALGLTMFLAEKNFAIFIFAYGLTSMGGSLSWPSLYALMADKAAPSEMKFFFAVQGFSNQIGTTIATFFGIFAPTFLRDRYNIELSDGYGLVFLLTALCAVVPIFYVLRVSERRTKVEKLSLHFTKKLKKTLLVYCLQNALIGGGAGFVIPWLPIIFNEGMGATETQVAMIITLSNSVLAVGWLAIPKFAELRGSVALIAGSQIVSCVPLVLIPYSPGLIFVALLYTARQFLMLVPSPVLNAYLVNIVSGRIRASFLALGQVAWQLPFSASYAAAGYLWANNYSKVSPFLIAAAFYIAASVIFWAYFKDIKENVEREEQAENS